MEQPSEFLDKRVLISWTLVDEAGAELGKTQLHGIIKSVSETEGILVERSDGGGTFALPPDLGSLEKAEPGDYRNQATGEIVTDPDYVSVWTIKIKDPASVEDILRHGYRP